MGLHRSALRRRKRTDDAVTKVRNRVVKDKERARRSARMVSSLRAGSLPYSPLVMSWLSRELGKQSSKITPDDVKAFMN